MSRIRSWILISIAVVGVAPWAGCSATSPTAIRQEDARIEEIASRWPSYRAPRDPANLFDHGETGPPQIDPSAASGITEDNRPLWTVTAYQEWDLPQTAEDSLARIGADAVPAVTEALHHPDPLRRVQAARILARIGPSASKAVPALIAALKDQVPEVRKAVARALGQIGPGASDAVGPLLKTIDETAGVNNGR